MMRGEIKEEEEEDDADVDALHLRQCHSTIMSVFASSSSSSPFALPLVVILSSYPQ